MGPGRTLGMPGGTWLDPGGMPGGTLVAPFRTLFRLVMPGQAWWDLVGPGHTLGMPGWTLVGLGGTGNPGRFSGQTWSALVGPGQPWTDLVSPNGTLWLQVRPGGTWSYL